MYNKNNGTLRLHYFMHYFLCHFIAGTLSSKEMMYDVPVVPYY